jgi:nicotinamidase-related amidase
MSEFVIPAKPYEYEIPDLQKVALVVIDMQRDFVEPGGFGEALGNKVELLRASIPAIDRLLKAFRKHGLTIIHTVEGHQPDLSDCPPSKIARGRGSKTIGDEGDMGRILVLGEPGNGIINELAPLPGEKVLPKPGKGAFCRTDLEEYLQAKGITHLLITGVTTEVCVQTTMREANDRGYECLIVEDATDSYFPEFKSATIAMIIAQGGIVGWASTSEEVVAALG